MKKSILTDRDRKALRRLTRDLDDANARARRAADWTLDDSICCKLWPEGHTDDCVEN